MTNTRINLAGAATMGGAAAVTLPHSWWPAQEPVSPGSAEIKVATFSRTQFVWPMGETVGVTWTPFAAPRPEIDLQPQAQWHYQRAITPREDAVLSRALLRSGRIVAKGRRPER